MTDQYFLSVAGVASPAPTERILWQGRCAVAEYGFEMPASLPRWTLPEETVVVVTDDRVVFADPATGRAGELSHAWPQHVRVQPGNGDTGRSATVTQIQLVCAVPNEAFPALVFAGGDLGTAGDAHRLANGLRQAVARYRVEHAARLGLSAEQARMLSRLVIGPEFTNRQGGEGQTVSLLGAVPVDPPDRAALDGPTRRLVPPREAQRPDAAAQYSQPDRASHAADLADRVASMVSGGPGAHRLKAQHEAETVNLSAFLTPRNDTERTEVIRRAAARLSANAAHGRDPTPKHRDGDADRGPHPRGGQHRHN